MNLLKNMAMFVCFTSPLAAMSYEVQSLKDFNAIVKKLSSGDSVIFAPGAYGKLNLNGQIKGSNDYIRLVSKEIGKAEFSNVYLQNIRFLELDGFKISQVPNSYKYISPDPRDEGRKVWEDRSIVIAKSEEITIRNCIISDMEDENHNNDHNGVTIRDSQHVLFEKNELSHLYTAAIFQNVSDVQILQNDLHDIRNDGINIAGRSNRVTIELNTFEDFFPHTVSVGTDSRSDKRDHADHIQIHSVQANERAENIIIRENRSLMGANGKATQSIFIQASPDGSGIDNYNIEIVGNYVSNGHHHGISVFDAKKVLIEDNTVLQAKQIVECDGLSIPGIHARRVEDLTINNNTSKKYSLDQKSFLPVNNVALKCGKPVTDQKTLPPTKKASPKVTEKEKSAATGMVPRSDFSAEELKAVDELFGY